ncbi:alpha/beta hydrolase [Patulibacter minatonensis]|uniref:alpha/beta hydrolase n=1 Tax=Patulibacter minatonensis TaxID=298163 RepID=UPI00068430C0|nr:alpha/beta fold hydrolase [Patulibacter minatonensis]
MSYGPAHRTYARDHDAWRTVQPLLPAAMRTLGDEPEEEAWTSGAATLHLDRYRVEDAPATVVVLHGGGGHGRLLSSAGRLARDAGIEAVMPDLPGYGLTDAPPSDRRYEAWVRLAAGLVVAERERSGRPLVVAGMSLGGMLAWHVAASLPVGTVAGVVATNLLDTADPAVRAAVVRHPALARVAPAALRALPRRLDDLRVPLSLVGNVGGISNDPAVTRALVADRRGTGSRVALGFLRTWLAYEPPVAPEDWEHGPVLLAHPGADAWTPTALSLRFFDRIAGPKRFLELEDGGHLPMEEPGLTTMRDAIAGLVATPAGG